MGKSGTIIKDPKDELMSASASGDLLKVEEVLESIKDLPRDLRRELVLNGPVDNHPPLAYAAAGGHLEIVKKLVDAGAIIDLAYEGSRHGATFKTPLMHAKDNGHPEVVQFLLDKGATIPKYLSQKAVIKLAEENKLAKQRGQVVARDVPWPEITKPTAVRPSPVIPSTLPESALYSIHSGGKKEWQEQEERPTAITKSECPWARW